MGWWQPLGEQQICGRGCAPAKEIFIRATGARRKAFEGERSNKQARPLRRIGQTRYKLACEATQTVDEA